MDTTAAVNFIVNDGIPAVAAVATAVLLLHLGVICWRHMRDILGSPNEPDYWEGYTAEDDARDRAAAGYDDTGLESSSPGVDAAVDAQYHEDMADFYAMSGRGEYVRETSDCPACGGWGSVPDEQDGEEQCGACNGSGLRHG